MIAHIYDASTGLPIVRGEVTGPPPAGAEMRIQIDDDELLGVVMPLPPDTPAPPAGIQVVIPLAVISRFPAPHLNRRRWLNGVYFSPERVANLRRLPKVKAHA